MIIGDFINQVGGSYKLIKKIPITMTQNGEHDFTASFDEANIAIGGISYDAAFETLVDEIIDTFDYLSYHENELGPGPEQQLIVLNKYIEKVGL